MYIYLYIYQIYIRYIDEDLKQALLFTGPPFPKSDPIAYKASFRFSSFSLLIASFDLLYPATLKLGFNLS